MAATAAGIHTGQDRWQQSVRATGGTAGRAALAPDLGAGSSRRRGRRRRPVGAVIRWMDDDGSARRGLVLWLVEDCKRRKVTNRAYAQLLGMSESHWSNLKTDARQLTADQVRVICERIEGAEQAYMDLLLRQSRPGAP